MILASSSARRRELLGAAGVSFEVHPSDVPEDRHPGESPEAFAQRVAHDKASHVAGLRAQYGDTRPVLGANTIVVVDGDVLGKPGDREDARRMLRRLAGRSHEVLTGFCLVHDGQVQTQLSRTTVTFKPLRDPEITRYLDRAAWQDKAGAYAVQEHAAYMVRHIDGSYTNVVGLPLCETIELLERAGVLDSERQS